MDTVALTALLTVAARAASKPRNTHGPSGHLSGVSFMACIRTELQLTRCAISCTCIALELRDDLYNSAGALVLPGNVFWRLLINALIVSFFNV
jgi:hypothetical protein